MLLFILHPGYTRNTIRCMERPTHYRERQDQCEKYNEAEFRDRFYLIKETVQSLIQTIRDKMLTEIYKEFLRVLEQLLTILLITSHT